MSLRPKVPIYIHLEIDFCFSKLKWIFVHKHEIYNAVVSRQSQHSA